MEAHIKPIWDEKDLYTANGLTPTIPTIICPIALVERLDILMASKAAGNTGVGTNWYQFAMNC